MMESLLLMCMKEISLDQQCRESVSLHSLDSVKAKAEEAVRIRGEELKLKSRLKEAEDELVRALSEKIYQESRKSVEIQEASVWYNKTLGLRVEGGSGKHKH